MEKKDLIKQLEISKAIDNDINEYNSCDINSAYGKVRKRIKRSSNKRIIFLFLSRVAAILVLPFMLSTFALTYWYFNQDEKQLANATIHYYTVNSAPGTITELMLPDSSRVWLNSNSTLRYPAHFVAGERVVWLNGEGYFDVESDLDNPFYVSITEDIRIKAFGTKFNISSYQDDSMIETTLESGSVDIIISDNSFRLKNSHLASIDKKNNQISITETNMQAKTAWKDGYLIFRNTDIKEAVKKISRRYNVDITLHNPTQKAYKVRATFTNETVTQVLNFLKAAIPMEWEMSKIEQNKDETFERQSINLWLK